MENEQNLNLFLRDYKRGAPMDVLKDKYDFYENNWIMYAGSASEIQDEFMREVVLDITEYSSTQKVYVPMNPYLLISALQIISDRNILRDMIDQGYFSIDDNDVMDSFRSWYEHQTFMDGMQQNDGAEEFSL